MRRLWLFFVLVFSGVALAQDIGDWGFHRATRASDGSDSSFLISVSHTMSRSAYGALIVECFAAMPTGVHVMILDDRLRNLPLESIDVHFWADGRPVPARATGFPLPPGQAGVMILPDVNGALFTALADARTLLGQVMVSDSWAPQYLWTVRGLPDGLSALGCYEGPWRPN